MSNDQSAEEIKCIAVQMPVSLISKVDEYKKKTGKSKNLVLIELIEKGLNQSEN